MNLSIWLPMVLSSCVVAVWVVAGWLVASVSSRGRHRRHRQPDVFDQVLAAGSPLPFLTIATDPDDDELPFMPGPRYLDVLDDWLDDLPTEQLPPVEDPALEPEPVRHTSPLETARQRWGVECPIFAGLADEWGYTLGGDLELVAA